MEPATSTPYFVAPDGVSLHGEWTLAAGEPTFAALIVHGYADHAGRYGEVATRLAALGGAAFRFDYRGHGRAAGRRGYCERFDEFLGDLAAAVAQVRTRTGDRPLLVVAHSHGALITLRALCEPGRAPAGIAAVAVSSPFLGVAVKVSPVKLGAARVLSRVLPWLPLSNEIRPEQLSNDPATVEARRHDRLCFDTATPRWYTEATSAQDYVFRHADRISVPTLWLVAGADQLADAGRTREVFARAGGDKELHVYDELQHEVFNEVDRQRVFRDLERWVERHVPVRR